MFPKANSQTVISKVGEGADRGERPLRVLQVVQQLQGQAEEGQLGAPRGQQGSPQVKGQRQVMVQDYVWCQVNRDEGREHHLEWRERVEGGRERGREGGRG